MQKLSCGLDSGDFEFKKFRIVSNFMQKLSCGLGFGDPGSPELKREVNFRVEFVTVIQFWSILVGGGKSHQNDAKRCKTMQNDAKRCKTISNGRFWFRFPLKVFFHTRLARGLPSVEGRI